MRIFHSHYSDLSNLSQEKWHGYLLGILVILLITNCGPRRASFEIVELPAKQNNQAELFIPYLKQQIEHQPKEPSNYLKLAGIYIQQNKITEAKALLENAQSIQSKNVEILATLSKIYLNEGDTLSLRNSVSRLRKLDPEFELTLVLSAEYALLVNEPNNVIYYANRAILKNPYNDNCRTLLGKAYLIKRDSSNALQNFEQAYAMHSTYQNFSSLFSLVLSLEQLEAARSLISGYEMDGLSHTACLEWSMYYNEIHLYDSARLFLDKCKNEFPEQTKSLLEWTNYYYGTKNDSALQTLNLYLYHNPKDLKALILKARIKSESGDTREAIDLYKSVLLSDSTITIARTELDNLERKVAYLRLVQRKDETQKQLDMIKPLGTKQIN